MILGQKILKEQIDVVGNELQNEIIINNEQHQYNMTAINLKVLGVPKQDGEDVKETKCNIASFDVLEKIALAAKIDGRQVQSLIFKKSLTWMQN